jgi:hypothetical protein
MTDEQQPQASPPPLPPPPDTGPFAFPPPLPGPPGYGQAPRGFYPLDFDAITRNAWSVFRFAWPTFLGAALVPTLIVSAFAIPAQVAIWPEISRWAVAYQEAIVLGRLPRLPAIAPSTVALLLLIGLVTILGAVVVGAAVAHIGDSIFRGAPVTIRSALTIAVRRLPALIGAGLLFGLAVFGIALLGATFSAFFFVSGGAASFLGLVVFVGFIAAMLFVAIRWSLLTQTIVLEKHGPVEGLSRSWRLVAGSGWRVLGYTLFIALISGVIGAVIGVIPEAVLRMPPTTTNGVVVGSIFQGLLTVVIAPIALVMLFLYYDLRFKRDGHAPLPGEARETTN